MVSFDRTLVILMVGCHALMLVCVAVMIGWACEARSLWKEFSAFSTRIEQHQTVYPSEPRDASGEKQEVADERPRLVPFEGVEKIQVYVPEEAVSHR